MTDGTPTSPGRRRAAQAPKGPSPLVILGALIAGCLLTAAVWIGLVVWAISLGRDARADGQTGDWVLMIGVTVLAVLVLGALLWLLSHLATLLGWRNRLRRK